MQDLLKNDLLLFEILILRKSTIWSPESMGFCFYDRFPLTFNIGYILEYATNMGDKFIGFSVLPRLILPREMVKSWR